MHKVVVLIFLTAAITQAQEQQTPPPSANFASPSPSSAVSSTSAADNRTSESRWYARVGVLGAVYHSNATFAAGGSAVPGASAQVSNDESVTLDIGYDITRDISTQLMVGVPPRPAIDGQGTVASLGELGAVRYGPGILTGLYRVRRWRAFQPYVGPGVAYAIFLKDHDASVSDLHVANNFGSVLQAGAEYKIGERWSVFGDFKEVWLGVNAHGLLEGEVPVTAHVSLNPSLASAGIKYRFGREPRQ
jgi:outer membrane protein